MRYLASEPRGHWWGAVNSITESVVATYQYPRVQPKTKVDESSKLSYVRIIIHPPITPFKLQLLQYCYELPSSGSLLLVIEPAVVEQVPDEEEECDEMTSSI